MSKPKLTEMQERAVLHGKGNALVSASAGSGKTHVVIERIIRLIIEEGVSVKKILAVTFTKLAAEEMKEKLKTALTKKYLATKDKRLKEELDFVNGSDISTIDSFCSKLIKKYFYVIGIDSSVQVLEESKKKRLSETAMNDLFEELYESGDQEFLSLVSTFAVRRLDNGLKEVILKLNDFAERAGGIDALIEKADDTFTNVYDYLNAELKEVVYEIATKYGFEFSTLASSFTEDEKRKDYSEKLASTLSEMQKADDLFEFFNRYDKIDLSMPRNKSKQPEYATALSDTVKEYRKKIEKIQPIFAIDKEKDKENLKNSYSLLRGLLNLTKKYAENLQVLKAEENGVDFTDIERYALALLKNEEIRKDVLDQYEYVFIDEYQDVNDVQEEIINLVTNNNAFLVGDSKQSIYAFRGCNPEYFVNKYRGYENGGGTAIPLDDNFRSAPKIIDGVNAIFSSVMTESFGGLNYADKRMIYGKLYKDYEGVCEIHVVPKVKKEETNVLERGVYSVKNATEKKEVDETLGEVKLILKIIGERLGKEYYDLKSGTYKTIGFSDICILLRSIGKDARLSEELVQSLIKAGVPVSSSAKKSIKDYPEIQVLLNLLYLIVNAERDVPLATVMLNLGGFSEDELASIKLNGDKSRKASFYDCVEKASSIGDALGQKCKGFLDWLSEKRLIAEFLPVDELFNSILKETGYLAKIIASDYGEVRQKRIERFILESTVGGKKLRAVEFESHVEEMLDDLTVADACGEEAVKIMTMHASKGLEFPVVIVAGLNKKFNDMDKTGSVIYNKDYGVGVKSYDESNMIVSENSVRSLIKTKIDKTAKVEELRLLYVALTRAKCELYMLTSADSIATNFDKNSVHSLSDYLTVSSIPTYYHDEETLELKSISSADVSVAGKETVPLLTDKIAKNLTYKYPYLSEIDLPIKSSVSDVNKKGDDEYFAKTDKFGSSSSEKGTAYHRFFELIDFYNYNGKADLDRFVQSGLMDKKQADFIDENKVQSILNLPIFSEIKNSKLLKEQKFCHLVSANELFETDSSEKVLIQGIADLIAIDNDGATLIDYKLSTIESEGDLIKTYKTQMALYKNAIEEILKLKVKKVVLINVLQEKVVIID